MSSSAKDYPIPLGVPVDKLAAMVLSKGIHWNPEINPTEIISDTPIECQKVFPRRPKGQRIKNLIGYKTGKLTVIGYYGIYNSGCTKGKAGQQNQLWVVRCVCGRYTIRRGKTLLKKRENILMCAYCDYLEHLKYLGAK